MAAAVWPTAATAALVACGGAGSQDSGLASPVNDGPVTGGGGAVGTVCIPSDRDATATYGLDKFTNTGTEDAVIDEVSVNSARNVELLGTDLVPIVDEGGLAGAPGYPPSTRVLDSASIDWSAHVPAEGALIGANNQVSLFIGVRLQDQSRNGSFTDYEVAYHVGKNDYMLRTSTRFVVPPPGTSCKDAD